MIYNSDNLCYFRVELFLRDNNQWIVKNSAPSNHFLTKSISKLRGLVFRLLSIIFGVLQNTLHTLARRWTDAIVIVCIRLQNKP